MYKQVRKPKIFFFLLFHTYLVVITEHTCFDRGSEKLFMWSYNKERTCYGVHILYLAVFYAHTTLNFNKHENEIISL